MTRLRSSHLAALLVLVLSAAALSGCASGADDDNGEASDGSTTSGASGTTPADGTATDADPDTTVVPADQVGTPICEALTPDVVGEAIGVEVTGTDGYGLGTPQCSYSFDDEGVITTVSVAVPRPDEDLGGLTGEAALDYSVELNQAAVPDAAVSEIEVAGADAAMLIESDTIVNLLILVGDQILTAASPALGPDQLTALGAAAVVALAG